MLGNGLESLGKSERVTINMFSAFRRGEKFKDHFETGIYVCAKCDYELFSRYFEIKTNDRNNITVFFQ